MQIKYIFFTILLLPTIALASEKTAPPASTFTAPSLTINIDKHTETITPDTYTNWLVPKTSLGTDASRLAEAENIFACPAPSKILCDLYLTNKQRSHFRIYSDTTFNEDAVKKFLEDMARRTNTEPTDATFSVENGQVNTFAPEQNGIKLNVEKSIPLIAALFQNSTELKTETTINLPFEITKPAVAAGEINNLGIATLIGEGTSNFKGSPANRVHNIKAGISRFNGVLIKPGEDFSFVKALGEVDAEHGYLPELVIKQGVTEPEFGGGICQVSTTVFRAAIYSGLEITARRNHAYPVSYYNPQGMDSTVYIPQPDLRFKNNTPGYILIQAKIEGTILTFDFYGTDDGRKTVVDGPTITERQPDGSLKATFTQHVFDKDGKEFIDDVFNSAYASPYKYPHPGGPTLSVKPSNWSDDEWKAYKNTIKDIAKAAAAKTN